MKRLYAQLALLALVAGCESTVIGTESRSSSPSPSASSSASSPRQVAHPLPASSSTSSSTTPEEDDLDCHGTATPCNALTMHTACDGQWGCAWIAE